ncbi:MULTISPECIES: Gfo/Idh/MocA family oxidoreductase [Thermocrispum]|uniref:Gfo/Idh/MocA family oxidoreductase n=2 Tax=Thermocrispum agreste TaxID=37925 RepID=A0ABD6FD96_9PSEU|nr:MULTISPECIES: Gfo/Idh/MocA family oxidoreductase [Thermocrispum]
MSAIDPDRPVRWGILGAGRMAGKFATDLRVTKGNELVAVAARDADRARDFAAAYGASRSYGSYADLLADDDVDVVYIATTHGQHYEQALQTFAAGKPALVEKAFTLNARQAAEVIDAARSRGLFCMEAMWMRTNGLVRTAVQLVADGRIGELRSVTVDNGLLFPFDPAHRLYDLHLGGGALLDLGVYAVTFAWIFLGEPARVRATGTLSPTGADQTMAMQWEYDDDRFAHVSCTTVAATPQRGVVVGTKGSVTLERPFYRPERLILEQAEGRTITSEEILQPIVGNGYGPEIAEVERCLRQGLTESPLVPLDDTLAIMRLMDDARAQVGVRYAADE